MGMVQKIDGLMIFLGGALFFMVFWIAPSVASEDHPSDDNPQMQLTVVLSDYRFEPSTMEIPVGQESELILINRGTVTHEFISEAFKNLDTDIFIQGVEVETTGIDEIEIPPGGKVRVRFTPTRAGDYSVACRALSPKNHFKEGMKGRLLIR